MTANWTPPRTWTIGELVTKDIMDTHVRDNLEYLYGLRGGREIELINMAWTAVGTPLYQAPNPSQGSGGTPPVYISTNVLNSGTVHAISRTFSIPDSYISGGRIVYEYLGYNPGSAYLLGARIACCAPLSNYLYKLHGTTTYATVTCGSSYQMSTGTIVLADMNGGAPGYTAVMQFWRDGTAAADTASGSINVYSIRFEWD